MTDQQTTTQVEPPITDKMQWRRDEKACVVEIDCRVSMQPVPGCASIPSQGLHRYLIERAVLPILMSRAFTRDDDDRKFYAMAAETFEREFNHLCDDDPLVQECRRQGAADEESKRIRELRATYGSSPEAVYNRDYRRAWPPFESVKVIDDNVTNPSDVARIAEIADRVAHERDARTTETSAAAAAVAAAVAKALEPLVAALAQQTTKKGG